MLFQQKIFNCMHRDIKNCITLDEKVTIICCHLITWFLEKRMAAKIPYKVIGKDFLCLILSVYKMDNIHCWENNLRFPFCSCLNRMEESTVNPLKPYPYPLAMYSRAIGTWSEGPRGFSNNTTRCIGHLVSCYCAEFCNFYQFILLHLE